MSEGTESSSTNPLQDASPENLISLAALLVIGSWLVFDVIADNYSVTAAAASIALLIIVLPRIDARAITEIAPVYAFLRLASYLLAAVGIVEIVDDIEGGILDAGGSSIFGALVAYAGYVLAFVGARKA